MTAFATDCLRVKRWLARIISCSKQWKFAMRVADWQGHLKCSKDLRASPRALKSADKIEGAMIGVADLDCIKDISTALDKGFSFGFNEF